jgi:negative regulator of flagellin synthesis FlgM
MGRFARTPPIDEHRIMEILMKIPPSTSRLDHSSAAQPGEAGRAKSASGKTATSPGGDAVKLSPMSSQLHALASSLSGPEFDRAKVDQIKQAIRDGKLVINTGVVADRMIEDLKARLSKSGGQ